MPCFDVSQFVISPKGLEEVRMLVPIRNSSSDMVAVRGGMGYLLACIQACSIRTALQALYALPIPASMPRRHYDAKHQCKKSDSAKFEDENLFPLGLSFQGQGLACVLQLSCSTSIPRFGHIGKHKSDAILFHSFVIYTVQHSNSPWADSVHLLSRMHEAGRRSTGKNQRRQQAFALCPAL